MTETTMDWNRSRGQGHKLARNAKDVIIVIIIIHRARHLRVTKANGCFMHMQEPGYTRSRVTWANSEASEADIDAYIARQYHVPV